MPHRTQHLAQKAITFKRFWSSDHGLTALLILLFINMFVIYPLVQLHSINRMLLLISFSLLQIAGLMTVSYKPFLREVVYLAGAADFITSWISYFFPGHKLVFLDIFLSLVFLTLLMVVILVQVFRQGAINTHRILGAVAVYILLGTIWSLFYNLVELQLPGAFQLPPGALGNPQILQAHLGYFSFVTLTTLGYGDIVAVHPVARTLVVLEALVGQLFPAILLARLVSMEIAHRGKNSNQ
jgi:hypothetical protein